jgi:D-amino-acid dehydrogenase
MKDVIIVGGGVVGLCCAWHLRQAGMDVTVLDCGNFTDGCSYGNAGMIVPSHFTPMAAPGMISKGLKWMFRKNSPFYIRPRLSMDLLQWLWQFYRAANEKHVSECAPLLLDLHLESRNWYEKWNSLPGFGFELEKKGILMLYRTAKGEMEEKEMAESAKELGLEVNIYDPDQLHQFDQHIQYNVIGGIHYPGDAHFDPGKFMAQMKYYLQENGVAMIPDCKISKLIDLGKAGCEMLDTGGRKWKSNHVVVAAGVWSSRILKTSGYRLMMQDGKGYSITISKPENASSIPALLHESRVAVTPMGDQLRISGTLEISGLDDRIRKAKINAIRQAVTSFYPGIHLEKPEQIWWGYRPSPPDGMPYIGRVKQNSSIIVATGHAMMGMSLGPVTGRLVRDIIFKQVEPHNLLYPKRLKA